MKKHFSIFIIALMLVIQPISAHLNQYARLQVRDNWIYQTSTGDLFKEEVILNVETIDGIMSYVNSSRSFPLPKNITYYLNNLKLMNSSDGTDLLTNLFEVSYELEFENLIATQTGNIPLIPLNYSNVIIELDVFFNNGYRIEDNFKFTNNAKISARSTDVANPVMTLYDGQYRTYRTLFVISERNDSTGVRALLYISFVYSIRSIDGKIFKISNNQYEIRVQLDQDDGPSKYFTDYYRLIDYVNDEIYFEFYYNFNNTFNLYSSFFTGIPSNIVPIFDIEFENERLPSRITQIKPVKGARVDINSTDIQFDETETYQLQKSPYGTNDDLNVHNTVTVTENLSGELATTTETFIPSAQPTLLLLNLFSLLSFSLLLLVIIKKGVKKK